MAQGKRAGARRGPKKRQLPSGAVLLLCLGITLCVVAWGFLVWAAIDLGSAARGGENGAWWLLALACVGAAACLFVALILGARLLRRLGIITPPAEAPAASEAPSWPTANAATETLDSTGARHYQGKRIAR